MPRGDDVFVRYYTRFCLEDFRFLRHGLAARAVFQHLSAVAVSRRSEFLPARYDAEALAVGMRAPVEEVRAGLEELVSVDRDPLVGRLKDGRLRIVDVRKCHGEKFRWIPEDEAFATWAAEHGETAPTIPERGRTGTNGDERGQPGALGREVRGETLEVRGDIKAHRTRRGDGGPIHSEQDTATPDGVAAEDWEHLLELTAKWPRAGRTGGLEKLAKILRANGPKDAEAWVRKAARGLRKGELTVGPWAVLARGYEPSDTRDRGGGKADAAERGGECETLDDVLAKGA